MKSTNYLIRFSILSTFLFVSSFLMGQCPNSVYISANNDNCITLSWITPPSPLPTVSYLGNSYLLNSGSGTSSSPAVYKKVGATGGCGSDKVFNGIILINGSQCTYANGTLPLNITNFSSKSYQNDIQVVWSANEPEQCIGYELEKSFDGKNWNVLTFKSNSTPNSTTLYSYIDNQKSVNTIY